MPRSKKKSAISAPVGRSDSESEGERGEFSRQEAGATAQSWERAGRSAIRVVGPAVNAATRRPHTSGASHMSHPGVDRSS